MKPMQLTPRWAIVAIAWCGLVFATLPVFASAPAESLIGSWDMNANLFTGTLVISSQAGNNFAGKFVFPNEPDTPASGTVTGARSGADATTPIAVAFTRTLTDGTIQIYTGAVSAFPSGPNGTLKMLMAGVFSHNGVAAYPWRAEK